jgi:hypothetical protein
MRRPEEFMRRALKLAERGAGWTSPNPLVGAVVVKKNIILGEGWHAEFGGPHAEFLALQRAGTLARGADLEVAWSFLRENLIDKILLVIAPKIVGGRAAPSPVGGLGVERLSDAIPLKDVTVSYLDGDILYEAYVDKESTSSP